MKTNHDNSTKEIVQCKQSLNTDDITENNNNITLTPEELASIKNLVDVVPKAPGYLGKLGDKGILIKAGKVVHKRTAKEYKTLWKYFLENEASDYFNTMGYTQKIVEKIGYHKFIDAHDWTSINDIQKWRTDVVHIIPCAHCGKEFATYELDLGLCDACKELYDLKRFHETCLANEAQEPGISYGLRAAFAFDETFRGFYIRILNKESSDLND